MTSEADGLLLLQVHRETGFVFDECGRMVHEGAPDRSRGRRFYFTGCADGNLAVIREDVLDDAAARLEWLLSQEPAFADPDAVPINLERYRAVLRSGGAQPESFLGLLWVFLGPLSFGDDGRLVWSGTAEGDRVVERFEQVMAASLRERGFRTVADLWAPWCVATIDGQVVSVAETVRSSSGGAEVGIDTAIEWRSRGLGATVTAGWSRHPELQGRTLFYSTSRDNTSSRKLTQRLDLRFLGSTFAVA